MEHALQLASQDLANELRVLLEEIDPARWRDDLESAARQRLDLIAARLRELTLSTAERGARESDTNLTVVCERLGQLRAAVERAASGLPSRESLTPSMPSARAAWASFQREVQPAYEALAVALRGMSMPAPAPLRPTNYTRNVFHVTWGLTTVALIELLPSRAWLIGLPLAFAIFAWGCEVSRRIDPRINDRLMKLFGRVAHAHERHRVNSSTWFVTALLILGCFFPREACAVGVAVLGLADPAAALVGRRFGRTKLTAGRSLEGTLTFFGVAFVAALAVLRIVHPHPWPLTLGMAFAGALAGALVELFTTSLDDNFTIPLGVSSIVALVGMLAV